MSGTLPPIMPSGPPAPRSWSLRELAAAGRAALRQRFGRVEKLYHEEARGARDMDDLLQGLESAASDLQRGLSALAAELRRLEAGQAAQGARLAILERWRDDTDKIITALMARLGVSRA